MVGSPSVASNATGALVAWSDALNGSLNIYVAQHNGSGWQMIADPNGQSVSNSSTSSYNPNLIVANNGRATVAWTEKHATGTDIRLAQFDPTANAGSGGWVGLGGSLGTTGLSVTGNADHAKVVDTPTGLVVVWIERVAGIAQIYAKRFNGTAWVAIGTGSASAGGISNSSFGAKIDDYSVSASGSNLSVAWTQSSSNGISQIYLRSFNGTNWVELDDSATGSGYRHSRERLSRLRSLTTPVQP